MLYQVAISSVVEHWPTLRIFALLIPYNTQNSNCLQVMTVPYLKGSTTMPVGWPEGVWLQLGVSSKEEPKWQSTGTEAGTTP